MRKITPGAVVTTVAGSGSTTCTDGSGTLAGLYYPTSVTVDDNTFLYVACYGCNNVRKIAPTGAVTTLAGSTTTVSGYTDGLGTSALFFFYQSTSLVVDKFGSVYVGDRQNNVIRKITSSGWVTTFAGTGIIGTADGAGTSATMRSPTGLMISSSGYLYFACSGATSIRRIPLYASAVGKLLLPF